MDDFCQCDVSNCQQESNPIQLELDTELKTLDHSITDRLLALDLSPKAVAELMPLVNLVSLEAGSIVFHGGEPCKHFVLPLSGSLHVTLTTASGREILLYTVEPGQLCVQTFQCLATGAAYSAEGQVVTDMEALVLPSDRFHALMAESADFRAFVLRIVADRFASLTGLVESVASVPVSVRLAKYLLAHSAGDRLSITQDSLAVDISSSREGVSRMLNHWKQQGLIGLSRGEIKIRDRNALIRLSHGPM